MKTCILIGLLLITPAAAFAQPDAAKLKQIFAAIDTNTDGVITLAEWTAAGRRELVFRVIDANRDGRIVGPELAGAMARLRP